MRPEEPGGCRVDGKILTGEEMVKRVDLCGKKYQDKGQDGDLQNLRECLLHYKKPCGKASVGFDLSFSHGLVSFRLCVKW
jgi:hypothetical protein